MALCCSDIVSVDLHGRGWWWWRWLPGGGARGDQAARPRPPLHRHRQEAAAAEHHQHQQQGQLTMWMPGWNVGPFGQCWSIIVQLSLRSWYGERLVHFGPLVNFGPYLFILNHLVPFWSHCTGLCSTGSCWPPLKPTETHFGANCHAKVTIGIYYGLLKLTKTTSRRTVKLIQSIMGIKVS